MLSSNWSKLRALSWLERLLLVEAAIALAGARLMLLCSSFRKIAVWFGSLGVESCALVPAKDDEVARMVGRAVQIMAKYCPWDSHCLAQTIAAWSMLKLRGIASTAYFGVARGADKQFRAHAWLRCGTCIVTGAQEYEKFQVVTCFSKVDQ